MPVTTLYERISTATPRWALALAAVLFLWNLWGYDFWAPDEPYFAEGAREMLVDGQWLVPHENGEITTDKPPLFFWLIAAFSSPVGAISGLTARLPSALAGLGSLALVLSFVTRGLGQRTAALSAFLLMTTYLFWVKSRWSQIDATLCFFILCALFSFDRFRASEWSGRKAGLLFWTSAALAVLAKGPVGVLLPLGIVVLTLAFDRELGRFLKLAPLLGPLLFLALTLGWAVSASHWVDGYSAWGALREHFVDRGIHGRHHAQPFWYYLKVLPYALFPWSFLIPGALLLAWRRRTQPVDRFLLVWALFVLVFFSISTEKRDLYILPAVPALIILIARLIEHVRGRATRANSLTEAGEPRLAAQWVTVPMGIVGALILVAALAIPVVKDQAPAGLQQPALGLSLLLGIFGLALLVSAFRARPREAVARALLLMVVVFLFSASFVFPAANPEKSGRELAAAVTDAVGELGLQTSAPSFPANAQGKLLGLDIGLLYRHVNLYTNGLYVDIVPDVQDIAPKLSRDGPTLLLTDNERLSEVIEALGPRCLSSLYETRLSRRDVALLRIEAENAPPSPLFDCLSL